MRLGWWTMAFPGLAITLTILATNLLGNGLRDVLDPRLRVR
jgi:peptide/nickel transport system permease protein